MHGSLSLRRCAGIALALLLSARVGARADLIQWGYNWTPSATKITSDGGGSGWISLTNESSKSAAGSSNTVLTNLRAFSTAPQSNPDTFTHASYTFTLQLQDSASKATGSLTFSGFFSGTLTADNANIKNTLTSPATQQLNLGGNTYSVSIGTYTPPGPPGVANAGSLNATVTATPGNNGGGGVSGTPEPSTLTLAALALPCTGLAGWRRRKRRSISSPTSAV
ncbi:MAG TPA: hypothetical protein VH643_13110 [Gemmataceae bacterium]|jgi:hypothetical protein